MIDTVEFFRKRLGTKLTWHAEPGATVNLNEIGFRKIFTQSQGGLLAIPWDLLLRRDLERLCCISGEKGKEEAIGDDFSEEQFRLTRSRKCIQNPLRRYRRKKIWSLARRESSAGSCSGLWHYNDSRDCGQREPHGERR